MYTAYDRMLIGNHSNQVAFFDGEKWLNINGCDELSEAEVQMLLNRTLELANETADAIKKIADEAIKKGKK